MLEFKPQDKAEFPEDKQLSDIVQAHLSFMKLFSSDDDVSYTLIISQSKEETEKLTKGVPDSVNITGNYFEVTFIDDNSVKVVIVTKKYVTSNIERYIDCYS